MLKKRETKMHRRKRGSWFAVRSNVILVILNTHDPLLVPLSPFSLFILIF